MESKQNKQPYYVFFSIDGTFWDLEHASRKYGTYLPSIEQPVFNEESVIAFKTLVDSLDTRYDTKLVVISYRRSSLARCIEYLNNNGVAKDKAVLALPYPSEPNRQHNIINYMENYGEQPFRYRNANNPISRFLISATNRDFKNYVIIDANKNYSGIVPKNRLIKTNYKRQSLTSQQVTQYLKSIDIPVIDSSFELSQAQS